MYCEVRMCFIVSILEVELGSHAYLVQKYLSNGLMDPEYVHTTCSSNRLVTITCQYLSISPSKSI